jgi:predicted CXXCH cytochrome family protein
MMLSVVVTSDTKSQIQGVSKMLGTKHNLGVTGTGAIHASSETQLCVFCHTPHVPRQFAAQPLWNHQLSSAEYTLYSSDYLTDLNYNAPNQPNARSKLCLSCHDGTVAIGAVYNNGGAQIIALQNDVSTMPGQATGNLGTSLLNDHPIGYTYDNTRDPELIARTWPWKTSVRVDPDAANGTVECITCHEPHDDANTKFLRIPNTNAALCTFCHSKTGWTDAIHKNSTQSYTPSGGTATTIGEWACRSCHQSHGGGGVPYLLTGVEENTCFGSGCHGTTQSGINTKNIQSELEKLYNHPTTTVTGKHRNPDNSASLNAPNRHAECQDCHNLHQAKKGLHTIGTNAISDVLTGTAGVLPGYADAWTQPTTYTSVKYAQQENQICFKCHSSYAFGTVLNGVTTILGPSGTNATDQAMEFNASNKSVHPVSVSLTNQTGSLVPKSLLSSQLTPEWNNIGNQTMYCSDCHGNDQPVSQQTPQGPHGSNAKFMLTGNGKYWPANSSNALWSLSDVKNNLNNWQTDLFCANCHPMVTGGIWTNNVHEESEHQNPSVKCITCHVAVPHGAKRSRLIGYESDVSPYNYSGIGTYDKLVISGFQKANGPLTYDKASCSMNGVCHGTQIGFYEP